MALFDPVVASLMARLATAPAALRSVGRWRSADSPDAGDHLHAITAVYLCLAGRARIIGGPRGRVDLGPGDAVVIAPGVRHAHEPLRRGAVIVDLGFIAGCCDFEIGDHTARVWCKVPAEPYATLCDRLLATPAAEARVGLLRQLLTVLRHERVEAMGFPHPAVRHMAGRLWANTPGLTAAHILAASGLAPRRAHAVFTAHLGLTPKQAILAQRLALAASFLADGATVAAAAQRAGFLRRADLTRAWTRVHGTPPRRATSR